MKSRGQGAPYFRRYGRELVWKPTISLMKCWGGYRRTTYSSMLVRGVSSICLRAPKRKKSTGRWPILGLVLATRGDVLCNMLAERGANKSDGCGLGSSAAEWLILPAGGELMRSKAGTRSVLRRAVSSARTRKVLPV